MHVKTVFERDIGQSYTAQATLFLVTGNGYVQIDAPYCADSNGIGCLSSHDVTTILPKLLFPPCHLPQDIDDTKPNGLCRSCHNQHVQKQKLSNEPLWGGMPVRADKDQFPRPVSPIQRLYIGDRIRLSDGDCTLGTNSTDHTTRIFKGLMTGLRGLTQPCIPE